MKHLLLLRLQVDRGGQLLNALGLAATTGESRLLQRRGLLHVQLASRGERQFAVRYVLHFLVLNKHILRETLKDPLVTKTLLG